MIALLFALVVSQAPAPAHVPLKPWERWSKEELWDLAERHRSKAYQRSMFLDACTKKLAARTSSVVVQLTCPEIPSCPPSPSCECGGFWHSVGMITAGAAAGATICAVAK